MLIRLVVIVVDQGTWEQAQGVLRALHRNGRTAIGFLHGALTAEHIRQASPRLTSLLESLTPNQINSPLLRIDIVHHIYPVVRPLTAAAHESYEV